MSGYKPNSLLPTNYTNYKESRKGFARSAFGVRGVYAPLFTSQAPRSKATRGRVALRKLREIKHKLFTIRGHLLVSWVKTFSKKIINRQPSHHDVRGGGEDRLSIPGFSVRVVSRDVSTLLDMTIERRRTFSC